MSAISKNLILTSPDGAKWRIPVTEIINHRVKMYGDTNYALKETVELFSSDDYEIEDWAANNMNWSDVKDSAVKFVSPELDMQTVWCEGEMSIE